MNLVTEIIRETRKSLLTIHVRDESKLVSLEYDDDSKTFKTTIVVSYARKRAVIGEENAREVLEGLRYSALKETMDEIHAENDKYYTAKLRLIKLAQENFEESDVIKLDSQMRLNGITKMIFTCRKSLQTMMKI